MAAGRRALYSSERHRSARCRTTLDWDGGWVEQATGLDPGRWSPRSRGAIEPRVARQSRSLGVAQMAVRWAASDRERRCGSLGGLALAERAHDPDRQGARLTL
jgi:hypothetical protein